MRVARRIVGCPFQAEDIVQEAFLRFEKGGLESDLEKPIGYLSKIVTNLSIDLLRRRSRESRIFDSKMVGAELDRLADPKSDPESRTLQLSDYRCMLDALGELPERERQAVLLHMVEGYTVREIAERLGVSTGTAHTLVKEGTLHCRLRLKKARN